MRSLTLSLLLMSLVTSCSEEPNDPVINEVPNCTTDGQVGCVARANFPAVNKATLTANLASLRTGNTIAGVEGTLAPCATDNGTACVTSAEYPSVVKAEMTAGTLVNGSTLAGVTGTFAAPCTTDGQSDCLTTANFKAILLSSITSFDIRAGFAFGGLGGTTSFYRNGNFLDAMGGYNRTAGTGSDPSTTVADNYDSIDDAAGGLAIPILMTAGAPAVQTNWVRDSATDTDADQSCNGMEICVYKDLFSGLSWLSDNGTAYTWEGAITYCEALTVAATTDWRVPTQKELLQAYINRIYGLRAPMALTTGYYFSATNVSVFGPTTTFAWATQLAYGVSNANDKTVSAPHVLCVR